MNFFQLHSLNGRCVELDVGMTVSWALERGDRQRPFWKSSRV